MKTTKQILAILLAAFLTFGMFAISASAAEPMYTGIHGELRISSPDHDVSKEGNYEAVDLGGGTNGNMVVWLQKPGRYTVELAPGVTEATHTTLMIVPAMRAGAAVQAEVTLRNLRMRAPLISSKSIEPAIYLNYGSSYSNITLKLEGKNVLTAPQGADPGGKYHFTNYLINFAVVDNDTICIEGSGSLTLDARGSANIGGMGKTFQGNACEGYPKININSGVITAYGGEGMPGIGASNSATYENGLDLRINGGTVTSIGGQGAPGIGDMIYEWHEAGARFTSVTITGGAVTAIGNGAPGIGGCISEDSAVRAVATSGAINGDAVVFANSIQNSIDLTRGLVFSNNVGTLYGNQVTVTEDVTFPAGSSLTIPAGKTLAVLAGKTIWNDGTITNDGTVLANTPGYGNLIPELHSHSYAAVVIPPTRTVQGCTVHTCHRCGDQYVDSFTPVLKRSFLDWILYIFAFGWIWMR